MNDILIVPSPWRERVRVGGKTDIIFTLSLVLPHQGGGDCFRCSVLWAGEVHFSRVLRRNGRGFLSYKEIKT